MSNNKPETNNSTIGRTQTPRSDEDQKKGQQAISQSSKGEKKECCGEQDGADDENTATPMGAGIQKQTEKQRSEKSVGNEAQGRDKSGERSKSDQSRQTTGTPVGAGSNERD